MSYSSYSNDLSYIHESGFTDVAEHAADYLLKELESEDIDRGLIVDLGCGDGTLAQKVTEAGFEAAGYDISPGMIERARQKVPEANFEVSSIYTVDMPSNCSAITATGEIFNYLFDDSDIYTSLESLFQRIYKALEQDGVFLFDVLLEGYLENRTTRINRADGDDWYMVSELQPSDEEHKVNRIITSFVERDGCYHRTDETHQILLLDLKRIQKMLISSGFTMKLLDGYDQKSTNFAKAFIHATKH